MLEAGTRLGPYEIVALQGTGGMGEVYRARDTRLRRTVALKVVSPAWSNNEEGRQRFEREARLVSQISHPNVCALFDVGRRAILDRARRLEASCLRGGTLSQADKMSRPRRSSTCVMT